MNPLVTIVIPALPADRVAALDLARSLEGVEVEVRVVEARSTPRRATQMNEGAAHARGEWLLFLHADCRLPDGWLDRFRGLPPDTVGGWFQFALADEAWQARVIEHGVALRVALFRLPYGDQGLFARRSIFVQLGGFPDLPLLEDVALVRALVMAGPVVEIPLPLTTSARRWHRDGWFRRSLRNLVIVSAYFAGVSPHRLALWYSPRPRVPER